MTKRTPWLRILVEGVVIVGSILLAFGLQAWWDGVQERRAEAEYLAALLDETERNLDALSGNRRINEGSYAAVQRAERLIETGLYTDSASVFVASLVRGSLGSGGPRIATAVFDELTSSGRVVVIEDLEIRRRVLELYAQLEVNQARSASSSARIDAGLHALVARHLPSRLVVQFVPMGLDDRSVSPEEMRTIATSIGSEASLLSEIRAEIRDRESQRSYLNVHQDRLELARDELTAHLQARAGR